MRSDRKIHLRPQTKVSESGMCRLGGFFLGTWEKQLAGRFKLGINFNFRILYRDFEIYRCAKNIPLTTSRSYEHNKKLKHSSQITLLNFLLKTYYF